jgi:hypothetical protein
MRFGASCLRRATKRGRRPNAGDTCAYADARSLCTYAHSTIQSPIVPQCAHQHEHKRNNVEEYDEPNELVFVGVMRTRIGSKCTVDVVDDVQLCVCVFAQAVRAREHTIIVMGTNLVMSAWTPAPSGPAHVAYRLCTAPVQHSISLRSARIFSPPVLDY